MGEMEKMQFIFMLLSLGVISTCFGISVWFYLEGLGMFYMLVFFGALVWYFVLFRRFWKQIHSKNNK